MRKNILSLSQQLSLDLFGYDQPNENGVFWDCERIRSPIKNSYVYAEVRIARAAAGWLWGRAYMIEDQGSMSSPNECDIDHGRVVPNRMQAISNSCAEILDGIKGVNSAGAKMVASWIESIMKEAPNVPPR